MSTPDNLARVPVSPECQDALVRELDQHFVVDVICERPEMTVTESVGNFVKYEKVSKKTGMVHFCARFAGRNGEKDEWKMIRCDYPDALLERKVPGNGHTYMPLPEEIMRLNRQHYPPDQYYTMATFFGSGTALYSLRGLWVDLDNHKKEGQEFQRPLDLDAAQHYTSMLVGACQTYHLPTPWVIYTGRGLQLVWQFCDPVPCGRPRFATNANKLQYSLRRLCEWFGQVCDWLQIPLQADTQTCNLGRLLRVPGTYNGHTWPRAETMVLLEGNPCLWSDFVVLGTKEQDEDEALKSAINESANESAVSVLPTTKLTQVVAESRLERLKAWCAGRGYDIHGYRNTFLYICARTMIFNGVDKADLLTLVDDLNARLVEPLRTSEVRTITRSAITNDYPYPHRNDRIIELLGMSDEEAQAFGKSSSPSGYVLGGIKRSPRQLAYEYGDTRVPHKTRDKKRRKRKIEKAEKYAKIPGLVAKGLSYREIAKRLGIGKSTVEDHLDGH